MVRTLRCRTEILPKLGPDKQRC